jgi:hypothetical protein
MQRKYSHCSGAGAPLSTPFSSFGVLGYVYVVFTDPCAGAATRANKIAIREWCATVPDSEAGAQCRVLGSPTAQQRKPPNRGRVYREVLEHSR